MPGNIAEPAEQIMTDWVLGTGTPTRPTTPIKCRLMTALGTDAVGGTEVTGGTYTPQSVTFAAAALGGDTSNLLDLLFTLMPAVTVVGLELWDSAGTPKRLWFGPLTAAGSKAYTVTATTSIFTSAAHGLAAGDRVQLLGIDNDTAPPAGLSPTTVYFVVAPVTADTFQVSATSGGAFVVVTAAGGGIWQKCAPKTLNAGDTFELPAGQLTLSMG